MDIDRIHILPQYCIWAFIFLTSAELLSRGFSKLGIPNDSLSTFHCGNIFNNYGFVAYGLIESLYGPALLTELFTFVIVSEIALWTRGRALFNPRKFNFNILIKNLPLWAFITALTLKLNAWSPFGKIDVFDQGTYFIVSWAVPLAIFGLGGLIYHQKSHFKLKNLLAKEVTYSLTIRHLILPPVLFILILIFTEDNLRKAMIIEAVMPSSMMVITLAKLYGGKPEVMSLMVFCSQCLSLITIPIWLALFIGQV